MKQCAACGRETNLVIGLGGVLLCRDECYPEFNLKIEQLRAEGKPVDVTRLAAEKRQRLAT